MPNITVEQGQDTDITINITDNSGVAVDITGWEIQFISKDPGTQFIDDTTGDIITSDAVINVVVDTFSDPTSGSATIPLSKTDLLITPSLYSYRIYLTTSADKRLKSVKGSIRVEDP